MHIALITTHLNTGGIGVYTTSLAQGLARKGHKVTVISSGGDMEKNLSKEGVSHKKVNIKTESEISPRVWHTLFDLSSFIKKERPDIIHAQTRVTQMAGTILAKKFKIPYISTCHGFFKRRLGRRLFDCWGDKVIAISASVKDHLTKYFDVNETRVELIHNGVDVDRFANRFSEDEKDKIRQSLGLDKTPLIGTIARLSPVKGIGNLILAFGKTHFLNKKSKLIIIGDGPDKEALIKLTQNLGISDKVKFVDSDPDTPKLLSIMDVFVLSSIEEGLGLSLIEALASGKAVVATNVGGVSSLIKDKETGFLVEKQDHNSLAIAINRLLDDERLRLRFGTNGRNLVRKEFSLDKMVDKTEKLYEQTYTNYKR